MTVQKVCRYSKDEAQVRETIDEVWVKPEESRKVINGLTVKNQDLFEFEKKLEN